jgi:hypothetical protein
MTKIFKAVCLISMIFCLVCTKKASSDKPVTPGGIGKAFVSFRIGDAVWMPEERCRGLLGLFDKYKGVTDEVTFFTQTTHAPLPPEAIKERTEILKDRMNLARSHGYKTGINILCTLGHHAENMEYSLKGDYTGITNIEGTTCGGAFCPNDEAVREYIRKVYRYTVEADPDYIWIDDDVRFGHGPVGNGCFCENCLDIFEKETGVRYTRESLKKAFNEGLLEEKLKVRESWLEHNRNTLSRLFELIEQTVHEIDPDMPLGFMTGDRFFEGYDFGRWAEILAGPHHSRVMWRPGGGFYDDYAPGGVAGKSHDIGRQVSVLPAEVVSIQSEIENFPYQRLRKAANIVALEAGSYIAAGCTGTAFNVLSFYDEPLDEYEPLLARLQEARPFFDLMVKHLGRSPHTGIHTFWNKDSYKTGNIDVGNWVSAGRPLTGHEFYDIGLSVSYSAEYATVTILGKDNIYALPEEEIQKILSGGVYMDAAALQQLNRMGFGELTGFDVTEPAANSDRIEKLTAHPLNGKFAGRLRDNRQSFWCSGAVTLCKTNEQAQSLSGLMDYAGKERSDCTMGIFENKLGGRICVSGYYPWSFMGSFSKTSQMKAVFRWLSKDSLPGYIGSFHKISLWLREPQNGKIALAFANFSFDAAKNLILKLKTDRDVIRLYDMQCNETEIRSSGTDGPYREFVIPQVGAWQICLAVAE